MSASVAVCSLCDYSVPMSNPHAVDEVAEHLRRKHPRYVEDDAPGSGGTLEDWITGARHSLQRFTMHRQSIDASVAVASRLRTSLVLLKAVEEAMRQADGNPGSDRGLLNVDDIRVRWQRILDGR